MIGLFLILIGLGYFALLTFLLTTRTLDFSNQAIKVQAFFVGFGVLLIWVGFRFLKVGIVERQANRGFEQDRATDDEK